MPSKHFIRTYLNSFLNDPVINESKALMSQQNGHSDETGAYQQALQKLGAEEFEGIIDLCTKEISENTPKATEARLLRGTFYFLCNQQKEALEDFNQVLAAELLDKRVSLNFYTLYLCSLSLLVFTWGYTCKLFDIKKTYNSLYQGVFFMSDERTSLE